jgi:hypothetical protein
VLPGDQRPQQRAATIPAEDKVRLTEALARLVQLYAAWGKPDAAAQWRQELEARQPVPKSMGP